MLGMKAILVELAGLGFTYMSGTPLASEALKVINLSIEEGEFIGLIGPTGSGKSTLLQHLNGLLVPTEGKAVFRGREIGKDIHPHEVRNEVGLVFQFPESQLFEETIAEDIAFGPKNLELTDEEVSARVEEALALVGLDYGRFAGRSPFELSGGEQRLVAIAGVLAMKPRMLVLDEPTSGLDAGGKARIMRCITDLNRDGMTIVLVSHDIDEVAQFARRVIVLNAGRIALEGDPAEVFSQVKLLKDIGLTVPVTTEFLVKLSERGFTVNTATVDVEATVNCVLAALKERQWQ